MVEKDVQAAADMLQISVQESNRDAVPFDPGLQVEQALSTFLQERLKKIQEDRHFEELVKDALSSRIAEASFDQLMELLSLFQRNVNMDTANILSPFIPRAGERVPALDTMTKKKSPEETLSEGASKEILQAFGEFSNMLLSIKKTSDIKNKILDGEPATE